MIYYILFYNYTPFKMELDYIFLFISAYFLYLPRNHTGLHGVNHGAKTV